MQVRHFLKTNAMLIAALAIVGITSAFKSNFATETFYYHGSSFDQASMETESNWSTSSPSSAEDCGLASQVTCEITIPEGYRNLSNNQLDGTKAIVLANSQANASDPTTVNDVKSTATGNPSLNPSQVKGEVPAE